MIYACLFTCLCTSVTHVCTHACTHALGASVHMPHTCLHTCLGTLLHTAVSIRGHKSAAHPHLRRRIMAYIVMALYSYGRHIHTCAVGSTSISVAFVASTCLPLAPYVCTCASVRAGMRVVSMSSEHVRACAHACVPGPNYDACMDVHSYDASVHVLDYNGECYGEYSNYRGRYAVVAYTGPT